MRENLTAKRMKILQKAREEYTFKNVQAQDRRIRYWDTVVTELNYIMIKVYSHGTLRCLKRKVKTVFSFCLCCLFLGIRCTYFIFLCLSGGKTPLIKIMFVKVLLMLIC